MSAALRTLVDDQLGYRSLEHFSKLIRGHRPTEIITLALITKVGLKERELLLCFDALSNDPLSEAFAHVDHGADDGGIVLIGCDFAHERPVNLQSVDGE